MGISEGLDSLARGIGLFIVVAVISFGMAAIIALPITLIQHLLSKRKERRL